MTIIMRMQEWPVQTSDGLSAGETSATGTTDEPVGDLVRLGMLFPEGSLRHRLAGWAGPLETVLGLSRCNAINRAQAALPHDRPMDARTLDVMNVHVRCNDEALAAIPTTGPVVVVANHPFGGLEGLALASILRRARPDVKLMANFLLSHVAGAGEMFIYVDPFEREGAQARNSRPMRETLSWLRDGHLLGVFPGGTVSHWDWQKRRISDPAWDPTIARLILRTQATVVPVYFPGRNSLAFQALGTLHPKLRTLMLPRELVRLEGREIEARIGQPMPIGQYREKTEAELLAHLRARVYMLSKRGQSTPVAVAVARGQTPIAEPLPAATVAAELAALPAERLLVDGKPMQVWLLRGREAPAVMHEVGRVRELTFRAVGEGTGQALDLDRFDDWYDHLVLWDRDEQRVTGGYRLGRLAEILPRHGVDGLYTATLYDFKPRVLEALRHDGLELGRSYICHEYQRRHNSLLLLWQAIGRYVAQQPGRCALFGTVSFSADYQPMSHRLGVAFLDVADRLSELSRHVRSRRPVARESLAHLAPDLAGVGVELEDITGLIADLEPDHKGIPVLLKQYLKLGGKVMGFNRDPDFGNTLDVLMLVDLRRTNQRLLRRYMGPDAHDRFTAHHAATLAVLAEA